MSDARPNARRRLPSVPTIEDLKLQQRRVARRRATTTRVLARMRHGEILHLSIEHGHSVWRTSSGLKVPEDVARSVIAHSSVCSVGDSLFITGPSQTWRSIEST